MTNAFRVRLVLLTSGIVVAAGLILSSVQKSWRHIMDVEVKLALGQSESLRLADAFQQRLLNLNNAILRYAGRREPATWVEFKQASEQLAQWMDKEEEDRKLTPREHTLLNQIKEAYDVYLAAAWQVHTNQPPVGASAAPLAELKDFDTQSHRLLDLGEQLAEAHRVAKESFLAGANQSLESLRVWLLARLGLLLALVVVLAWVLYRDLIAPLRTRLVRSQELLERQEKLATLGTLAAGIAHEIRNPLTSIKARLYTLGKRIQGNEAGAADAAIISSEIRRLEQIVQDVLQFARPSEPQLTVVRADTPLREVQTLMTAALARNRVRLVVEPGPALCVPMDVSLIKQVLVNLVRNAAEAIPHEGTVTLRVREGAASLRERPTQVAILEVTDTGKGIPPEVQKRLFDPFFSTKESGTGLGLAISARIIERHGGTLQYQTQVGRGTTFGIVLPLVNRENERPAPA